MKIPNNIIQEMLNSGNTTLIKFAKENNPKSNFEIACEKLGIEPVIPDGLSKQMQAMFQLEAIIKVANGGKIPDVYDTDTYKYSPVFLTIKDGAQVFHYVSCWHASTYVPAFLLFNDEKVCEEVAKDNLDLYIQLNS